MEKYKSEVDRKSRLLKEQREDVEAEWTAFKEGFIGTAEEICGRTPGKKEALKSVEEASDEEKTKLK